MRRERIPEYGLLVAIVSIMFVGMLMVLTPTAGASQSDVDIILGVKDQAAEVVTGEVPADEVIVVLETVRADLILLRPDAPEGCQTLIGYEYALITLSIEAWELLDIDAQTGLAIVWLLIGLTTETTYQTGLFDCMVAI